MRSGSEVVGMQSAFAMTDTLWARVADVLAAVDSPPPATARALLDAMVYRALTGTPWDSLPAAYPPAAEVAASLVHWRASGVLDRLEAILLFRLDG